MKHYWCFNGKKYEIDEKYVKSVSECIPENVKLYNKVKKENTMKYESEFRIKEKEFYPREKHSHKKVIDELANIVKRADMEIEELELDIHDLNRAIEAADYFNNDRLRGHIGVNITLICILALSLALNAYFIL